MQARLTPMFLLAATLLAFAPASARADGPMIMASDAWARPTPGGAKTGAAYLTLMEHGGTADHLTGASTPAAERAEVHETRMQDGVMRMRPVESLEVPAGGMVALTPGGLHLMLMGLKHPLKAGETFPVTLSFAKSGNVEITVTVQAKPPAGAPQHAHDGMQMNDGM